MAWSVVSCHVMYHDVCWTSEQDGNLCTPSSMNAILSSYCGVLIFPDKAHSKRLASSPVFLFTDKVVVPLDVGCWILDVINISPCSKCQRGAK